MLLVEQLSPSGESHAPSSRVAPLTPPVHAQNTEREFQFTPTFLGILVHAAADGLAFGGAAAGNNHRLEMVIFLAIMIHKAPAAFGMTSYMLSQSFSRRAVQKQLLIFSCVAPTFTILTYLLVTNIHVTGPQHVWTGAVLLFSAGSFLYVATVHVLPEVRQPPSASDMSNGSAHSHAHGHRLPWVRAGLVLCCGPLTVRLVGAAAGSRLWHAVAIVNAGEPFALTRRARMQELLLF